MITVKPNMLPRASILVIDASEINLQIISVLLKKSGYEVAGTTSPPEAFSWLEGNHPDLTLLSADLPDDHEFNTCRSLKNHPSLAKAPIILLTSKFETEPIVEGFRAGGSDYISIPYRPEELITRIEINLNLKQAQHALAKQNEELRHALGQIASLRGQMVTMCAWTKRIMDQGQWISLERFLGENLKMKVTHGICEDAMNKLKEQALAAPKGRN